MDTEYELDRLIAERVMDWHYEPRFPGDTTGYLVTPDDRIIYEEWPAFGSDIAAAWQVVDHLADMGYIVVVTVDGQLDPQSPETQPRYTAHCDNFPRQTAATAPLAICRAALVAVGAV